MGSKILAYVMVLVYSHYITAEDLGYYDLILTTIAMIQPIVVLQISDGVYRFIITANDWERQRILTVSFKFICITTTISEIILYCLVVKYNFRFPIWIALYMLVTIYYYYFHEIIRAYGESKRYAAIGILNSILMLIVEIIGLFFFRLGVVALISANVISMAICIAIMIIWSPQFCTVLKTKFNTEIFKDLLTYSAPLVPNTVCWWIVNSSDRYIILWFLGSGYNGIYAISNKFPTIMTTITGIFYLAWQEAAIKEYSSPNRDVFFSNIFDKYYTLLLSLCAVAVPMTHIVIELFVGSDFKSAWIYSGFLYLGAAFSALCSFLGLGYQISKETQRSIATTIVAAIINIAINVLLIKQIRLQAASLSTFLAYLFLFFIRIRHTRKYFKLSINWTKFLLMLGLALVSMMITTTLHSLTISWILACSSSIYVLFFNRKMLLIRNK